MAAESHPAPETKQRHPRGLYTLFFTEMWERCSYYGMRAILTLFLIDSVRGGMGLSVKTATAVYGLCTAGVYLAALPGGWIADRFLGAQKSVWYGGIIIALGDFMMVLPGTRTFYLGLVLIVFGTGLLKPNVSAIVGQLYPEGGARRDAGFSIFYMGINLGAFIAPFICSSLAEKINWRLGFAAPGIGMIFGLLQFHLTKKHLGEAGLHPGHREGVQTKDKALLAILLGGLGLLLALALTGILQIDPLQVARYSAYVIAGIAVVYFTAAFLFFDLDPTEKKRVVVILVLFLTSALFWSGFEQAGSSFSIFAKRYTTRTAGFDFTTFRTNDIADLPLLAGRLTGQSDEVSKYLWGRLTNNVQVEVVAGRASTNNTQTFLTEFVQHPGSDPARLRHFLLRDLNNVILDKSIFDSNRFAGVKLSPATAGLVEKKQELEKKYRTLTEDELARMNRFLLEDTYTKELTQNQSRPVSFVIPVGWAQSAGPFFVFCLAPLAAMVWLALGRRGRDPSLPAKFAFGLVFLGLGFLVMWGAARIVVHDQKVWPTWLIATFLIHTIGELCVSPVGLSSVTKLAPRRMVGQMMGIWFLATSLGNLFAGLLAGRFNPEEVDQMPALFMQIVLFAVGTGLLVLIFSKPIKKLMVGVK